MRGQLYFERFSVFNFGFETRPVVDQSRLEVGLISGQIALAVALLIMPDPLVDAVRIISSVQRDRCMCC